MQPFERKIIGVLFALLGMIAGLWWWNQARQLPDFSAETVFYLGTTEAESGQLMAFDPTIEASYALTPKSHVVNQYVLYQRGADTKKVLYFSVPKSAFSSSQSIANNQTLYQLDLLSNKRRQIKLPPEASLTSLHPEIVNDSLFFESENHVWKYSLRQQQWYPVQPDIFLRNISLSAQSQLLLGANALENFGYLLTSLVDETQTQPVGNYFENFGFSPSGTKLLLKQKPDQDIFSDQSFLVVFNADGTAQNLLEDQGDALQAVWTSEEEIFVVLKDENFDKKLLQVSLEGEKKSADFLANKSIQWINFASETLWIVTEEQVANPTQAVVDSNDIQSLLDTFAQIEKRYQIWSYDLNTRELTEWPIQGFFPRIF